MSLAIRWRLTISIALAVFLAVLVVLATLRFGLQRILNDDLDTQLHNDLRDVSAQLTAIGSLKSEDVSQAAAPVSFSVVIRDETGRVLASTQGFDLQPVTLSAQELRGVRAGLSFERTANIRGDDMRIRTGRVVVGGQVAVVQVAEDSGDLQRIINALELALVAEGAGGLVLAAVVGYWLGRSALKPIDDVVALAEEIEASDFNRRLGVQGKPAEVQRLAETFDAMLERLGQAFEQQRTFVLDVSHELKTPLTALRGNVDVLLMDERVDEESRAQLVRMSAEVQRLIRLVSNLLYLARADTGGLAEHRALELDALCLEVYAQMRNQRPDVKLRLGHQDQVTICGDRDLLKQLILNLVDNGLKFAPSGAQVALSVHDDDAFGRVEIADTGPGIPAEDLPHIFERYFRGSEERTHGRSGLGIGLAIGNWIVREHGGTIEANSHVGRGSTFTVRLPKCDAM